MSAKQRADRRPGEPGGWLAGCKVVAETLIGIAGIAVAVVGSVFTQEFRDAEAAAEASRDAAANQMTQRSYELEEVRLRAEILEEWLPEFLGAEDASTAERMIVGLLAADAEAEFRNLRDIYAEAGLLSDELEERLEEAIAGAARAAAGQPRLALDFGTVATQEEAEAQATAARELGFTSVSVVGRDGGFAVVVDVPTAEAGEALLAGAEGVSAEAAIADLSERADATVPDIYGAARADGVAELKAAGFTNIVVWEVTSGSVASGFVRQVVLDDGSAVGAETIVVDSDGARIRTLDPETPLAVKVSSGSGR